MAHLTRLTSLVPDTLTAADYRDIYEELRSKCSLARFVALAGSQVSKAWWSKYERGDAQLTHERRNELRAAVGLPALPDPPARILARVHPDATIWQIGAAQPDCAILIGADAHAPLTLQINGDLRIEAPAQIAHVTPVTPPQAAAPPQTGRRHSPAYFRPCLSRSAAERIPQLEALLAAARQEIS